MRPIICFTSFAAYPLFHPEYVAPHGGAEVELFFLAKKFAEKKNTVHMVVGDLGQPKIETVENVRLWRGIPIQQSTVLFGIMRTLSLFRTWKDINADIYLVKGAGGITFQLALFCTLYKKKYIMKTSHKKNIDLSLKKKPYHAFYRWALTRADAVIVQNKEDIGIIQQNYHIAAKVIKNYHPIPPPRKPASPGTPLMLVWVGRITSIKRPHLFLDLAKKFPEHVFRMIGFISDTALWQKIKKESERIPNLTIITNEPHHKMDQHYQQASLLVSTSSLEGFPNTFIEAMKWGVPIASLSVNPDQCITKHALGIVGNDDLEYFANQLKTLIENPKMIHQYGKNAYHYASKEFGENIIHQWNDLFGATTKNYPTVHTI